MCSKLFVPFFSALSSLVWASPYWTYECINSNCLKVKLEDGKNASALEACWLTCDEFAGVWPRPTGFMSRIEALVQVNATSLRVEVEPDDAPIKPLLLRAVKRLEEHIKSDNPNVGKQLKLTIRVEDARTEKLSYDVDESYKINITSSGDSVSVHVDAVTFFGARHGLETLGQVIVYDDFNRRFLMPESLHLSDTPVYPHRGILLDTSRNYISVKTILRTLEGMAASKLNYFHWHLTDSHSFPYVSKSLPELSRIGAYAPNKVYTPEDVEDILEFARVRGIAVVPEFDAPAHVGEGWQETGYVACFGRKPYMLFCPQPPCGQLDPTQEDMYDMLEVLYKDMMEQFDPPLFHMGGDEVNTLCWASEPAIVKWMLANNYTINKAGFMKLWAKFQSEALERLNAQSKSKIPILLWTSDLTKDGSLQKYLSNDTYIIQVWTSGSDKQVRTLLENNFRIVLSNVNALYFDCGFGSYQWEGPNWCSPYKTWQVVYENSPAKIAGKYKHLVMGAEAALWTETAGEHSVDSRLWPRASAMAERVWAEPKTSWRGAENRMWIHRERLLKLSIGADAVEPEWCLQHQKGCRFL